MQTSTPLAARTSILVGLVALVVLAIAVRAPALHRLLPHAPEPDAFVVLHAEDLRGDPWIPEHVDYAERYPSLLAHALALIPAPRVDPTLADDAAERAHLAAASRLYVDGRALSLLLSLLTVPLVFALARRFTSQSAALLAAGFVATSLLHALFSTQARPHGAVATLSMAAILCAIRLVERPSTARAAIAAVATGLAIACLQTGFFALPPLVVAAWLVGGTFARRLGRAAIVVAIALAVGLPWYPHLPSLDAHGVHLAGLGSHDIDFKSFDGSGTLVAARWAFGHDPVLAILALAGAVLGVVEIVRRVRSRNDARPFASRIAGSAAFRVAAAHALPYALLTALNSETYERFLLPLLPWAAILAARGVERAVRPLPVVLRHGASILALVFPAYVLVRFAAVSARDDATELATEALLALPDRDEATILVSPGLALPVAYERESLAADVADPTGRTTPWTQYQRAVGPIQAEHPLRVRIVPAAIATGRPHAPSIESFVEELAPRYVLFELSSKNRFLEPARRLHEWLATHAELLGTTPGTPPDEETLETWRYQAIERCMPRLLAAERLGPAIEIWRIER